MADSRAPGSHLDVHLPDGHRLTVEFEVDGHGSADVGLAVATAMVISGDEESDVEAAVGNAVYRLGFSVATSSARGSKVMTVR
jgi:hypothetical protein